MQMNLELKRSSSLDSINNTTNTTNKPILNGQQTLDKLMGYVRSIINAINNVRNYHQTTLIQLSQRPNKNGEQEHEIITYLRMIPVILSQAPRDDKILPAKLLASTFAHNIYKSLYDQQHVISQLHIDIHVTILKNIRLISSSITSELTKWLFATPDEDNNKFQANILVQLCKKLNYYICVK